MSLGLMGFMQCKSAYLPPYTYDNGLGNQDEDPNNGLDIDPPPHLANIITQTIMCIHFQTW